MKPEQRFARIFSVCVLLTLTACSLGAGAKPTSAPPVTSQVPPVSNPSQPVPSATPALNGNADIIFSNGNILTMNDAAPAAQALAIQGDKIIAVGSDEQVLQTRNANTAMVDLGGRTLLPGFVDAHNHLGQTAKGDPEQFRQLQEKALSGGITTSTEMYVDPTVLDQLKSFDQAGLMKMRWNVYLLYNTNCGDPVDKDWYKTFQQGEDISAHIRAEGVKVFADGGSCHVPAVSFEYPGGYGQGDLYMSQEQLNAVVKEVQDSGRQVAIHALGDRAVEEAQNAIAAALNGSPNTLRHRIEHNAVLRKDLLPRYNQIGIIPTIFGSYPTCWRTNPSSQFKYAVPVELGQWEWAWRALLDANPGIKAAWHSDAPLVSKPDAIAALYGFVTRNQVADDGSLCQAPDWLRDGAITVDEALHIMTINSAYALFRENEIGSLETGKLADMVILSENPTQVQAEAIKDISVQMTMIGGQVEYCAGGAEALCPAARVAGNQAGPTSGSAALSMTASASAASPDNPPADAIDGSNDTWWSAGSGPEQWIQIDLGAPISVSEVRLVVSQFPEGETVHQLWAGPDANNLSLIHEFKGNTKDLDTLVYLAPTPLANIRVIKIVTTQSPSWVAWREIEVKQP